MAKEILIQTQDRKVASKAVEEGFQRFLLEAPLPGIGRIEELRLDGETIRRNGSTVGEFIRISNRADEHRVRALKGKRELVVVETTDWKVIPLENLIAALGSSTKLYAVARTPQEAELFLTTMEKGVDGIVVRPRSIAELKAYRELLASQAPAPTELVVGTVTRVEPLGMGERVCVDTTNLFESGEGLLIGSGSHGFFLVAAETIETEYVAARPFRVNAGAIHSYVLSGEATKYLSELRAGQRLFAVKPNGERREVVVGRAKIETRPLLLVEAEAKKRRFNVILQNAETIRLTTAQGRPKSVSKLKPGDKVLMRIETGARHFGMKVEERIREQ
jgi:3-dehydroquinate synthase II